MKQHKLAKGTRLLSLIMCCLMGLSLGTVCGAEQAPPATKTIVGDLLMVDRDLYIVRGERGEIQIEATGKTEITEEFTFGDRIKALVLMNNKALKIERAGPKDVPGVVENRAVAVIPPPSQKSKEEKAPPVTKPATLEIPPQSKQPDRKIIIGDLLMIDRDLYIVRGERGEIQIEATGKTEITEEFTFGDRIKALVLMNNKALKIERAGPNDVSGVTVLQATAPPLKKAMPQPTQPSKAKDMGKPVEKPKSAPSRLPANTRVVEGQILMIDGDFYVLRGDRGEIRVERTPKTKVTEDFKFGDFIKATVKPNDQAVVIERLK